MSLTEILEAPGAESAVAGPFVAAGAIAATTGELRAKLSRVMPAAEIALHAPVVPLSMSLVPLAVPAADMPIS
jgi:hypothetical protein